MSDKFNQIQDQRLTQTQKLTQSISQQQMLVSSLIELPVTQLTDRINTEMNDNPALEAESPYDALSEAHDTGTDEGLPDEDYSAQKEREDRQSALDEALAGIGRDDEELPVYHGGSNLAEEHEEAVYGEGTSFYDLLNEQIGELELTDEEHDIMEYLIGSLDDDGLLRKPLDMISDELAIYHHIDASTDTVARALSRLQEFDPAGIGARSLQECLQLQIARRADSKLKQLMQNVVTNYFDDFTRKHWTKIQQALGLTDIQAEALFRELRKLNPRPGASMGETLGRSLQQITPDYIIDTQDDGTITFVLNQSDVPELKVSQSFIDSMREYQDNKEHMSRNAKEALFYIKKKVEAAQGFIEAIKTRRRTLTLTMQAIITLQRQFFLDGDEASLRPMILKDVAQKTGLDLSTISRVSNSKYAQTRWGIFPLRHFFSDSYVTESGEELSTRQIKATLREIVDSEDRNSPLSDEAIKDALAKRGYPIARRTVAKYRELLGIPIARLRK